MYTPLEQFIIKPYITNIMGWLPLRTEWIDLTITNSTIYTILSIIIIYYLFFLINKYNNTVYGESKWKEIITLLYTKVEDILKDMFTTNYNKYIPLIFSLFIFILFNNLIGLIPYSFTAPSHIIFTLSFSLSIIIGVTIIGFQIHKLSFFKLFVPHGLNQGFIKFLIPLIFSIEIISYLMRILSLSVRLTANLLSGHTLLKILSTFSFQFIVLFPYLFFLPLILIFAVYLLEIGVAFIQAYVFSLLTATYIKDIYSSH